MKSIVICGSRRYKKEIRELTDFLTKNGVVVFPPILNENTKINELEDDLKRYAFLGLTWHHFEFIRKAEVAFFYNKDGYLGNSSSMELGAAAVLGKPIFALEANDEEQCRKVLFDEIVGDPQKLLGKLK